MSSGVQYVILCEDLQARVFIRRALMKSGANPRRIRPLPVASESGGGAGDQYVLRQYPGEVRAHRSSAARMQAALLVHIDVPPNMSVAQRQVQFDQVLANNGQSPRAAQERIAHLVPKREIETWIRFYLDGPPVDETVSYPKYEGHESDCHPAADAFADDAANARVPPGAPASLTPGLAEFARVLPHA